MVKQISESHPDQAASLKQNLFKHCDFTSFVADVEKAHASLVLTDSREDLHLNRIWFVRELCSWGVPREQAEMRWASKEDEFGNKLKSIVDDGEDCLIVPGLIKRKLTMERRIGGVGSGRAGLLDLGGRSGERPPPCRRSRSCEPRATRSRASSAHHGRRSRTRSRSRRVSFGSQVPSPCTGSSIRTPGTADTPSTVKGAFDSSALPLRSHGVMPGSDSGSKPDNDDDDNDDQDDPPAEVFGRKTTAQLHQDLVKAVAKAEAMIRDAPSEYEESAGLWQIQGVAKTMCADIFAVEKVII